jgi:hypothetical protein
MAATGDNLPVTESVPTAFTRLLRGSDEPLFQRLRALLSDRDVDPETAILADFFPDDVDQEFGLLVNAGPSSDPVRDPLRPPWRPPATGG